ncbi:MAG TPA: gamma-glutamyltransferase [Rhodothermales bacterium]|nr:gamma-glutamyltransferase [Rhodothermales bacterium]
MKNLRPRQDSVRRLFSTGSAPGRVIAAVALALCISTIGPQALLAQAGRTPVPAKHGMVASSHYLASEVGADILKRGGNAIDAVVATALAAAVVFPSGGNIGGGGFIVYHGADGEVTAFNFREKAPLAATERMFATDDDEIARTDFAWMDGWGGTEDEANHEGLLSVGVPGTVAGLYLAHERLGSLPWADLVQPAVDLAREGLPSSWGMQNIQKAIARNAERYRSTADAFLKEGDVPHEPGEIWKQPDLASTLERIRDDGKDGFYHGETARLVADFMRKHGGLITEEDLARYEAVEQPPIQGSYRGYDVYSMSPPSSGGVALVEMLNILEGYRLASMGHNSAQYLHTLAEAMRLAYRDRATYLGDPDFNPDMPIDSLISKVYSNAQRAAINPFRASVSDPEDVMAVYESEETTHISVVDSMGNAVALTYTLEYAYGSRIVVEGAGFLLNNEMGDFNPVPGLTDETGLIGTPANLVAPGKRMLSSMTPTIVARDGRPVLVVGTPGGRTIINSVLQVILNVIDFNMNVAKAVEAPRMHHQWLPDGLRLEGYGFSPDTIERLRLMGHNVSMRSEQGSVMAIFVDHDQDVLYGAADSRGFDSRAVGF